MVSHIAFKTNYLGHMHHTNSNNEVYFGITTLNYSSIKFGEVGHIQYYNATINSPLVFPKREDRFQTEFDLLRENFYWFTDGWKQKKVSNRNICVSSRAVYSVSPNCNISIQGICQWYIHVQKFCNNNALHIYQKKIHKSKTG